MEMKKVETYDSIFGDYEEATLKAKEGILSLKITELVPFENHPFKLYTGERLDEMIESIKTFGVITPIVARKKEDVYEILSGHNRINAAKKAGLIEVPVVIKDGLTEDEALLIVTETNLMQRSFTDLTHSERAKVIATRHQAMKKQGIRNDLLEEIESMSKASNDVNQEGDLTLYPMDTKLDTVKNVGVEYNLSRASVARYLRINELIAPLKDLIDEGKIAMRAGVDLSYLSTDKQEIIDAIMTDNNYKIDMKKSAVLKEKDMSGELDWNIICEILSGVFFSKENVPKEKKFSLSASIIEKYFVDKNDKKRIENTIIEALNAYFAKEKEVI